jgi:IclR family acetate operon transcriptional repressor
VGRPSVPHATAAGKVMLAFDTAGLPPVKALAAYTERTITDPDVLATELAAVRDHGWAEAVGEREPDLGAVAAPVFGRGGELAAILGIQGPASRLPASTRRLLRTPLLEAAAELSRALGASLP